MSKFVDIGPIGLSYLNDRALSDFGEAIHFLMAVCDILQYQIKEEI